MEEHPTKMQYGTWSRNIAVSLLILAIGCPAFSGPMDDAKIAGKASGNTVQGLFGKKENLNKNLSVPMTDSTTPMKTIDGSTSFAANLTSPSSASFLKVLMQPSGSGDLQLVRISQDINMDGTVDTLYTVPRVVSGVCANGYYSCTAGTWSNCQPYKWVSDGTGRVSDTTAAVTELGGCYCINSSCGSQLVWNNSALVLKDIGGGAVSAIQRANIGFTVTNVALTAVTIDYYGRLVGSATVQDAAQVATLPPPVNAQSYYTNPGNISSSVGSITSTQSGDQNSIYYNMLNSPAVNQTSAEQHKCTITRTAGLSSTSTTYSNTGSASECIDHYARMQIWKENETTYKLQLLDTNVGGSAHFNCGGTVDSNGWHTIATINLPSAGASSQGKLTAATFALSNMQSGSACQTGSGFTDGILNGFNFPVQTTVECGAAGAQNVSYDYSYFFEFKLDTFGESVTDNCQTLASDPDCKLKDETVDGVEILQNYNNTGLTQLPSCQDIAGASGPVQICRPWWNKKRTYICQTAAMDFSDLKKRYGAVVGGVSQSGNTLNYADLTKEQSGAWTAGSGSILMPGADTNEACEPSCRTQVPHEDNEITTTGVASNIRLNPSAATDYMYKVCVNGVCPLSKPGEVIIDDCQCLSNFNDAALAVQSLRMAGKDLICTSGQRKPL